MSIKKAAEEARRRFPQAEGVWRGLKIRGGRITDEECVVVNVKKKLPKDQVPKEELVPDRIEGEKTDVVEGENEVQGRKEGHPGAAIGAVSPLSLTRRMRPCPGGFSCGHFQITAGTLGAWVKRVGSDKWYILSNNHVIANSNEASPHDNILQPGPHDGGRQGDTIAHLTEYVKIRFEGEQEDPKKELAVQLMGLTRATFRQARNKLFPQCGQDIKFYTPGEVGQPYPNLVDAAVAVASTEEFVDPVIHKLGAITGMRDVQLGDRVQKVGRTTEHTVGRVVGIDGDVRVQYGAGKGVAPFQKQLIVMADSGEFSAGGDSGSLVVDLEMRAAGLLFAGGGGRTIVNRIGDVVSLLGVYFD